MKSGWLEKLTSFYGVLAFWIANGVAHSLLRLFLTRTLILDDARENELVQNLALGYQVRQPPLYEWLLWLSQQAFGTGIESHLVVRYSLIGLLGLATYGAARAAIKDERWAAAASLSLAFSYPVNWTFHEWATQTILLCIACMVTLHATIRFFERQSFSNAIWLGLAIGLGLQAKFSYPVFLGGLLLAALSLAETRRRLADPKLLISLVIAFLMLAPYLVWLVQVHGNVVSVVSHHMIQSTQSHFVRVLIGLGRLARSLPAFLLPWIAFIALLAPKAFLPAPAGALPASMAEKLTLRAMLFAALLTALGIIATGSTTIRVLYMHVILIVAPVYVFARAARLSKHENVLRGIVACALIMEVVIFGIRVAGATNNPITRHLHRGLAIDYNPLADALKQRGVTDGTVITVVVRDAGNLRSILPHLRVMAADSFRTERPPRRSSDNRPCVLIWRKGEENEARRYADIGSIPVEKIELKPDSSSVLLHVEYVWFLARLDPRSKACS
jgi:hypothetical protein